MDQTRLGAFLVTCFIYPARDLHGPVGCFPKRGKACRHFPRSPEIPLKHEGCWGSMLLLMRLTWPKLTQATRIGFWATLKPKLDMVVMVYHIVPPNIYIYLFIYLYIYIYIHIIHTGCLARTGIWRTEGQDWKDAGRAGNAPSAKQGLR